MRYRPRSSLTPSNRLPVVVDTAVTTTPGSTPPVESVIVPVSVASCAKAAAGKSNATQQTTRRFMTWDQRIGRISSVTTAQYSLSTALSAQFSRRGAHSTAPSRHGSTPSKGQRDEESRRHTDASTPHTRPGRPAYDRRSKHANLGQATRPVNKQRSVSARSKALDIADPISRCSQLIRPRPSGVLRCFPATVRYPTPSWLLPFARTGPQERRPEHG